MSFLWRGPDGPPYGRAAERPGGQDQARGRRAGVFVLVVVVVASVVGLTYAVPRAVAGAVTATQPTWDCDEGGAGGPSEEPDEFEDPVGLPTAARIGPGLSCVFTMEVTNTGPVTVRLRAVEDGVGGPGRTGMVPSFDWASVADGPQVAAAPGQLGVPLDNLTRPEDVLEAHAAVDAVIGPGEKVLLHVQKTGGQRPIDDCMRHGLGLGVLVAAGPISGRTTLATADHEPVMLMTGPPTEEGCA